MAHGLARRVGCARKDELRFLAQVEGQGIRGSGAGGSPRQGMACKTTGNTEKRWVMQVRYAPKSRRGMKPALSWRRACYALVLATVPAAAGNGTIELPDTASGSPAHRISLQLHFVAPPGPEQI